MSARNRRHHRYEDEEHANHERWLLTYADMITLLMVLFIVLFAISQIDQKKFASLAQGMSHAFGSSSKVLDAQSGVMPGAQTPADQTNHDAAFPGQLAPALPDGDRQRLEVARRQMVAALRAKGLERSVQFAFDERGLVVRIVTDHVLFATGSATLATAGREVLDAITPTLARLPNDLIVEGHTDNVPVSGRFPSNWELSAVRATTVLRYLLQTSTIDEHRISAAGYADERRLVPNDTAAHRARNRRVQVVVLAQRVAAPPLSADVVNPLGG